MTGNLKNLCAHIPVELHNKVREKQQASGKTMNEYVAELIAEFYMIKENEGGATSMETEKVLAVKIPVGLSDRLDEYLVTHRITKKAFIIELVRNALDAAEAEARSKEANEKSTAEDTDGEKSAES